MRATPFSACGPTSRRGAPGSRSNSHYRQQGGRWVRVGPTMILHTHNVMAGSLIFLLALLFLFVLILTSRGSSCSQRHRLVFVPGALRTATRYSWLHFTRTHLLAIYSSHTVFSLSPHNLFFPTLLFLFHSLQGALTTLQLPPTSTQYLSRTYRN